MKNALYIKFLTETADLLKEIKDELYLSLNSKHASDAYYGVDNWLKRFEMFKKLANLNNDSNHRKLLTISRKITRVINHIVNDEYSNPIHTEKLIEAKDKLESLTTFEKLMKF